MCRKPNKEATSLARWLRQPIIATRGGSAVLSASLRSCLLTRFATMGRLKGNVFFFVARIVPPVKSRLPAVKACL
jgi:hypothetical protein